MIITPSEKGQDEGVGVLVMVVAVVRGQRWAKFFDVSSLGLLSAERQLFDIRTMKSLSWEEGEIRGRKVAENPPFNS